MWVLQNLVGCGQICNGKDCCNTGVFTSEVSFILSKGMSYSEKGVTGSVAETINLVCLTDILNNHIESYNFAQK